MVRHRLDVVIGRRWLRRWKVIRGCDIQRHAWFILGFLLDLLDLSLFQIGVDFDLDTGLNWFSFVDPVDRGSRRVARLTELCVTARRAIQELRDVELKRPARNASEARPVYGIDFVDCCFETRKFVPPVHVTPVGKRSRQHPENVLGDGKHIVQGRAQVGRAEGCVGDDLVGSL